MEANRKRVIVLGNDHTNTVGIVQCMGREGYETIAVVWGQKTGIVKASRYAKAVYSAATPQACIELIAGKLRDEDTAIIACCDSAAIALEQNRTLLDGSFRYEHTTREWTIEGLCEKDLQVRLAKEAGFNVPWSHPVESLSDLPEHIPFPCITKSLVSCKGSKGDLIVVRDRTQLEQVLIELFVHTKRIIIQQYIERDYEVSILGCGLKNGTTVIPCVENKLTLYPKNVGLECLANMQPLEEYSLINPIQTLIKLTGYVGLFSVELMHCKTDGKFYFTEINLRNDGANSFVYQYGVNLPLIHVCDLFDQPLPQIRETCPGYYIWEMHHTLSLVHRGISLSDWWKEIRKSRGFLVYRKDDKKPIYKQYFNWILRFVHLRKDENYQ